MQKSEHSNPVIKDLQEKQRKLERTQNQLSQSAKPVTIGELAANVAHEVNNSLTSILGFTNLILQDRHNVTLLKTDLEIIEREALHCKSVIRGLLNLGRQTEPQVVPTDLNQLLQNTVALVRPHAKAGGVTIKETYDETIPAVPLDPGQIKQVFLNLMTNGIQAMPKGGKLRIVTCVRIEHPFNDRGGCQHVAIEFYDTGVGISEENLYRIFEPFFTTKEAGEGTGLGLYISQHIVEMHGGRIEVSSQQEQGSTFCVLLPMANKQLKKRGAGACTVK